MFADVALPSRRFQVFTYHIPSHLRVQVVIGSAVLVPLGAAIISGVVVRVLEQGAFSTVGSSNRNISFRDILSVDATPEHSPLDQRLLTLVEKIAEYYVAPLSACLRLIVPPQVFNVAKRLVLTEPGREALTDPSMPIEDRVVLQKLSRVSKGVLRSSLLRTVPKAAKLVTRLKKKGWIEERSTLPARTMSQAPRGISPRQVSGHPSPYGATGDLFNQDENELQRLSPLQPVLSGKRKGIADDLVNEGLSGTFHKHLVIGTDHERFQIFQQVVLTLLQQGRRMLLLVPEVQRAESVFRELRGKLSESVEIYHGQLSTQMRADGWQRIREGKVQLVVGTRSALFAPIPDLGLIWVDQEEDASYKDEHLPYYHAREVAKMRGVIEQALVVYGSSCPSLESYAEFRDQIPEKFEVTKLNSPAINIIDLRDHVSGTLLAPSFIDRLTEILHEKQQAIIILNRKGFSHSLICRDCGHAPACEICGVSLRLFQRPSRLLCSYCGKSYPSPETCSSCRGTVFRFSGIGTQRLEEELITLFPSHVQFRFDRDQVKTIEDGLNVLQKFRQGDIHILIGTEFLLHQPDLPLAKLVAFPQADLGLHLPDFRSAERTFLLFSKAVRLVQAHAQIDESSGEVFLQTRMPDHHVFQSMAKQDPHLFYQQELDLREALAYPPSAQILLLVVTGAKMERVQRVVDFLNQQLKEAKMHGSLPQKGHGILELPMVLGPLSSRKPRRLKKNRTIFLIKTFNLEETQRRLGKIQQIYDQQFRREPVVYEVHVDPLEIQ